MYFGEGSQILTNQKIGALYSSCSNFVTSPQKYLSLSTRVKKIANPQIVTTIESMDHILLDETPNHMRPKQTTKLQTIY